MVGGALASPKQPFVAIVGGAKISGKIDVLTHLLTRVDRLLVGGGMAFTFLKAKGLDVGRSLVDSDRVELAGRILADDKNRVAPVGKRGQLDRRVDGNLAPELAVVDAEPVADDVASTDVHRAFVVRRHCGRPAGDR